MAITRLTPAGYPGSAPLSAAVPRPDDCDFTALSVSGTPGPRHTFATKAPPPGPHAAGPYTVLTVYGLPGGVRVFLAKTPGAPVEPEPPPAIRPSAGGAGVAMMAGRYIEPQPRPEAWRDDEDFIELLALTLPIIME